jgi:hypothetical protein
MLWIAMGDGGSGGDPQGHGQNRRTLLGALLRIDVDRATPYAVPPDNPWADGADGQPEIWATGVRNPWRIWIDPVEDLLYVADVGQNRWEEVHVASAGAPGLNYGWNLMEGRHPYGAPRAGAGGLELPPVEYPHDDGCSITGGVVYRGRALPQLAGHYLFSDYCAGWIRSFRWDGRSAIARRQWVLPALRSVTSFGVDAGGEPLVVSHEGAIYRLVPAR